MSWPVFLMVLLDLSASVRESRLYELNKQFAVPSVRKPPPPDVATQAILEQISEDPSQRRGVGTINTLLGNEGIQIPRYVNMLQVISSAKMVCTDLFISDFIREVMATFAPEALSRRFPGANRINRSALVAIGPNHQHHADGHDKLNAQALNMGGVSLPIYGIKDQWASLILHCIVIPNNRLATTIGHVHLDEVEKHEREPFPPLSDDTLTYSICTVIPVTFVTDKGSETGYIYANQTGLR